MAKKRVKSELAIVFGAEPDFSKVKIKKANYTPELTKALQWYGKYGGAQDAKSLYNYHKAWVREWALANGFKKGQFTVPKQGIATVGALARIALRGFKLDKRHVQFLKDTIAGWVYVKPVVVDRAAQGRMLALKAKVTAEKTMTPFLTTFDTAVDSVLAGEKKWDIKTTDALNGAQVKELTAQYKGALSELQKISKDEQLAEAYGHLSKVFINRLIKLHKAILEEIEEAGRRGTVMRKAKAVRRKKTRPASSMVRKMKYLPVHNEYNLASIDPEKIVGAQTVYVVDTKKRLLKKFTAMGVSGVEVSGTTLKNVVGKQKKLRKPGEQLAGFGNMPKTKCEKLFNEIRAVEKECTGRVNESTVLLGVF